VSVDTKIAGGVAIGSCHVKATTFLASAHSQKSVRSLRPHRAAALAELTANGRHMMMGLARSNAAKAAAKRAAVRTLALATVNVDDVRAETLSISTSSLVCSS
jgi:hypothetical protein